MVGKDDQRGDAELVAALNRGEWAAFEVLYRRHREWVYRLAWRFCGDEGEAQDVVQEVFVYVAGKFPGFELRSAFKTFLYPAVKHTALALKRKRRRHQNTEELGAIAAPNPGANAGRAELAAVMAGLSEAHREVVLMRFVDDLTLEEIAEALGIPLGTAKSRLHHAIAALRQDPQLRKWFET